MQEFFRDSCTMILSFSSSIMHPSLLTLLFLASLLLPTIGTAESYDPCKKTLTSQDTNITVPEKFYERRCSQHSRLEELQLKRKVSIDERNARLKQHALELFQKRKNQNSTRSLIQKKLDAVENENRNIILEQNRKQSQIIRSSKRRSIQEKVQMHGPKTLNPSSGISKEEQGTCAEFQGIRQQVCLRKIAQ